MSKPQRQCIDCARDGITSKRKTPHPGPRCATHHRQVRGERRNRSHAKRIEETYSITSEQYWAIYEAQGGKCAICRRATGARKRLSTDHDHKCCAGPKSCGKCVRSLCCSACNRMLGHIRDDPEIAERIIHYLHYPPGRELLDNWNAQSKAATE